MVEVWKRDFTFVLTQLLPIPTLKYMELHLSSDLAAKLSRLAAETGRPQDELIQEAMAGYFAELEHLHKSLDNRYDDVKNGRVKPIEGHEAFDHLRKKSKARRIQRS